MDPIVLTPRLRLTLVVKADRDSPEFEWLHELRSNEKSMRWSIHGQSKCVEDTERVIKGFLPKTDTEGEARTYRVAYAVHRILDERPDDKTQVQQHTPPRPATAQAPPPTEFIGLVNLLSLDAHSLPLPEALTLPAAAAATTLTLELAYMFLPTGWGQGYATEAIGAVFAACRRARGFWAPFARVYVRAIVNDENPASLRVMEKTGMVNRGVYEWTGSAVWLDGRWTTWSRLHIWGMDLVEG